MEANTMGLILDITSLLIEGNSPYDGRLILSFFKRAEQVYVHQWGYPGIL